MTAPEKPWPDNAWLTYKVATSVWGRQVFPNTTEYVRADLHAAALAREAALREECERLKAAAEHLPDICTAFTAGVLHEMELAWRSRPDLDHARAILRDTISRMAALGEPHDR